SSSLEIANPLISFLKDRRQSNRLAFTCGCHNPINVGLILDLHLADSVRSNFRQEPEITGFYAIVWFHDRLITPQESPTISWQTIRGREWSRLHSLPFRTVHETFTSYGS
ncbi:hypothetical protein, partial [Limnospira platensis]|uniref:hypothetical protein n=4 Tax=Limnospira TaxID=2596745 RepID=UPI001A7EB275